MIRSRRVGRIFIISSAVLAGGAAGSEIWVAPTYQQDVGGLGIASNGVWPVTPSAPCGSPGA